MSRAAVVEAKPFRAWEGIPARDRKNLVDRLRGEAQALRVTVSLMRGVRKGFEVFGRRAPDQVDERLAVERARQADALEAAADKLGE